MVELSRDERQGLESLIRRHTTPQQVALRARIILSAADGLNNTQIARQLGVDVNTVKDAVKVSRLGGEIVYHLG